LIRTFETKLHLSGHIGVRLDAVFEEYAALMSRAERLLLAQVKAGRGWTGDLKVSFYRPLGMSATHLDMAYRQLMAKLSSVAELAKENLKALNARIASKKVDIKRKEKARDKARKNLSSSKTTDCRWTKRYSSGASFWAVPLRLERPRGRISYHCPSGNGLFREAAPFLDGYRQGAEERLGPCHPRPTREEGRLGARSEVEACMVRVERAEQGVSEGACSAGVVAAEAATQ